MPSEQTQRIHNNLAGVGFFAAMPFEQWDITPLFAEEMIINPRSDVVLFLQGNATRYLGYRYHTQTMTLESFCYLLCFSQKT